MSSTLEQRLQARLERYAKAVGTLDTILNHETFDSVPDSARLDRARAVLAQLNTDLEATP